jgi:NAD(P)H-nitrite reductase large subunit
MRKYSLLTENPIVCSCARVNKYQIECAIKNGCKTVEEINKKTGACCCCKTCESDINFYIKENIKTLWTKIKDFLFL